MSTEQPKKTSIGLDENVASLLCYLGWWITGIVFYVVEKENKTVKFNAMQSILTFGGINILMILCVILNFIPFIGFIFQILVWLVWVGGIILWIILMVKSFQGETYKLPVVGDMAEKQVK